MGRVGAGTATISWIGEHKKTLGFAISPDGRTRVICAACIQRFNRDLMFAIAQS